VTWLDSMRGSVVEVGGIRWRVQLAQMEKCGDDIPRPTLVLISPLPGEVLVEKVAEARVEALFCEDTQVCDACEGRGNGN
jgi:hypothetical protein